MPALRLHRAPCRPEESEAYDGPLEAASLAAYLHREARPAAPLAVATAEALQAELAAAPVAVVLFALPLLVLYALGRRPPVGAFHQEDKRRASVRATTRARDLAERVKRTERTFWAARPPLGLAVRMR